jgi:hypothetical protein
MKDFNEITSHVLAIDKADDEKAISFYERKKNLEALACKVVDELVAGRPVPVFDKAESVTRIDGMLPVLANELVSHHDMAIAHRTHLAERLEADGGENGAKAAAILRGMNAAAEAHVDEDEAVKVSVVSASDVADTVTSVFAGLQSALYEAACGIGKDLARSVAENTARRAEGQSTRIAVVSNQSEEPHWNDTARITKEDFAAMFQILSQPGGRLDVYSPGVPIYSYCVAGIELPNTDQRAEEQRAFRARSLFTQCQNAEARGFYHGRDKAWRLLMENQKRHPDTIKASRAFLGDLQRDLLHMQKDG